MKTLLLLVGRPETFWTGSWLGLALTFGGLGTVCRLIAHHDPPCAGLIDPRPSQPCVHFGSSSYPWQRVSVGRCIVLCIDGPIDYSLALLCRVNRPRPIERHIITEPCRSVILSQALPDEPKIVRIRAGRAINNGG